MGRPRFLADEMLGTLAKWLRMMGYDTEYARDLPDGEVLKLAGAEDRVILTRDKQLAGRAGGRGLLITSEVLDEQLEQVASAFEMMDAGTMTRCTVCNGELERVGKDAVAGRVPERVLEIRDEFYVCPRCGQIYWKGTHWDNITRKIEWLLGSTKRRRESPRF
jgi:uncharacterized protein with PIN domain